MNKFTIGDVVVVVNYGCLLWSHPDVPMFTHCKLIAKTLDGFLVYDRCPEVVGQVGAVREVSNVQGKWSYALFGVKGKTAWYDEAQLRHYGESEGNSDLVS